MNLFFFKRLLYASIVVFIIGVFTFRCWSDTEVEGNYALDPSPLIIITNVTLSDAILNFARTAKINYVIDPHLTPMMQRTNEADRVNYRWENVTVKTALEQILKDRHIYLIYNQQTTIAKISNIDKPPTKFDEAFIHGTNSVIPLITMEDVPLYSALNHFTLEVGVPFEVDRQLSASDEMVNIRWENLTIQQALAALCDNYSLKVALVGTNGYFKISQN